MQQFKVLLRKNILPFDKIDGRLSGSSVVGAGSTSTNIVFNPPLTGQSTSWSGGFLVFSSGILANLGGTIGTEHKTGSTLNSVDLAVDMQNAPSPGDTFWLIRKNGYISLDNSNVIDISQYVESVTFATDVEFGFERATVTLNQRISALTRIFSQFLGMHCEVRDVYGIRCYTGLVASADIDGWGGTINTVGYGATFGWMDFSAAYDTTATNTAVRILRDICGQNPYISGFTLTLDRDNSWHTQQLGVGGIGPRDYISQKTKASDAISQILSMGDYPNTFDKVAMQVWHDMIPVIKKYRQNPTVPDYIISNDNVDFAYSGITISGDINEIYTQTSGTYTDSNGKTIETPSAYNVNLIPLIGIRSQAISTSGSSAATAAAIVGVARQDKKYIASPGSIKIHGHIKHKSAANMIPVYLLKAGDVVAFENNIGNSSLYNNSLSSVGIFTVAHTSYNSTDGSMNVTPATWSLKTDMYQARIKV